MLRGARDVLAILATAVGVVASIASDSDVPSISDSVDDVALGIAPLLTFDGVVRINDMPDLSLNDNTTTTLRTRLVVETDAAGAAAAPQVTMRLFAVRNEQRELLSEDRLPAFEPVFEPAEDAAAFHAQINGETHEILAGCADQYPCEERFEIEIVVVDLEGDFAGLARVRIDAFNEVVSLADLVVELEQRAP
jgi:hypothetical protein